MPLDDYDIMCSDTHMTMTQDEPDSVNGQSTVLVEIAYGHWSVIH